MGLSDIAAGIRVTERQRERGVASVDDTGASLAERLVPFADALPCSPAVAATLVEAYAGGADVGSAARAAGLPPTDGAKALHLLGEPLTVLSPVGRDIVGDWLAADISRADALTLSGASEREFALAAFLQTHAPLDGAREALEGILSLGGDAAVAKRDTLGETMSNATDLRSE